MSVRIAYYHTTNYLKLDKNILLAYVLQIGICYVKCLSRESTVQQTIPCAYIEDDKYVPSLEMRLFYHKYCS